MKSKVAATLLAAFYVLTPKTAQADVIFQELYNYSDGNITNVSMIAGVTTNWFVHSSTGVGAYVKGHREEVSSTSGGNGFAPVRADDVHRNLATSPGSPYTNVQQVLYASFIVNFTNTPSAAGANFAHFLVGSTTFQGRLFAQTNATVLPNTYRLGIASASSTVNKVYPVDLALNTDYQVVLGYNPTTGNPNLADDSTTLWINPISSSDAPNTSGDSFTPSATSIASSFAFRQASGFGGFLTVSNLVVATTFLEAFTNGVIGSTNAVVPVIVTQPTLVNNNFVNSTFSIYGIATGQGLGNMTYQWQVSTSPANTSPVNVSSGDISGTTTESITFTSSQTTDSGYYTLIAKTPYGLSVTSSVAKVAITATPVPPAFVVQPGSQTIYKGQNMILTTTVSSPGNITYTWYSNNVVVTAGQTDSGSSSTLELDNVTTANSATYKVAVTNDVFATGVVSTNAVVTVLNAPQVSIGYLRTLVDPVTFVPNVPSTTPYQVTGVVTTYTNTTTGDTSSYFLQDGTGGINIFATFGSTFRPQQGDSVTYVGVLSSFSSGLELVADTTTRPYTSYVINSSGNPLPTPLIIPFTLTNIYTFTYINTNFAGRLVTLPNVYFGANAGTTLSTTANVTVSVTNAAGTNFNLSFFDLDLDTAGQTLPTFASSVTGVLYGFYPNYTLAVTKFSDINTTVTPVPIPLTANFSGGNITFTWSDPSFNLQTATNLLGPWVPVTGATSGFITNITTTPTVFYRLSNP